MVINHDKRFIFVHVPRTAGHSIYQVIGRTAGCTHPPYSEIGLSYSEYFSFGFMRNPWDRMFSCYRKQSQILEKYKGKSFKHYLLEGIRDNIVKNQALWFLEGCDYIGMFETLQDDWKMICLQAGLLVTELPRVNSCGNPDYRPHYDNEMIDHISVNHADDILLGGYSFE